MNMERIRYSHPVKEMLGKPSKGEMKRRLLQSIFIFSKAEGEIGTVIRAFVPIKDTELKPNRCSCGWK